MDTTVAPKKPTKPSKAAKALVALGFFGPMALGLVAYLVRRSSPQLAVVLGAVAAAGLGPLMATLLLPQRAFFGLAMRLGRPALPRLLAVTASVGLLGFGAAATLGSPAAAVKGTAAAAGAALLGLLVAPNNMMRIGAVGMV
jgi:hypothetical protein